MTNVRSGLFLAIGLTVFLLLTGCGEGDSPDLFARRVEASFDVTAKVTYEVTYDPDGTGNPGPVSTTITQGPWGRRLDSYKSRENMTFSGTFLDLSDEEYMCNRYTGLEAEGLPEDQIEAWEDGVCYDSKSVFGDSADELFGPLFDFMFSYRQTLMEDDGLEWEAASSRTIAGIDADCYEATSTDPDIGEGEAAFCFSDDDILLAMEIRSDGDYAFLALEVDREVQEADFALPYPVVDWPY